MVSPTRATHKASLYNADSSPAVVDGIVYLGSDGGNIYALNAFTNGAKLWNYTIGNGTLSTPNVTDGVLYVGSSDDNIYALNATNGVELWSYPTSGAVNSPSVINGVLYVGESNNIYALRVSPASILPSKPFNTLPILVGVVVTILIVATVVLLIFQKNSKKRY